MINSMFLHSFQDNARIRQLTKILKICQHIHFCRSWFSSMVSFRYVLVILIFFFFCFMSNKCFLILLNFTRCLFSVNTIFLLMRNIRNECSEAATGAFCKKMCSWKFHKIHRKTPVPETLLKKRLWPQACNFIKKGDSAQVLSCEFCEISKNIFFRNF